MQLESEGNVWEVTMSQVLTGQDAIPYSEGEPKSGHEFIAFYSKVKLVKGPADKALNVQMWDWTLVDADGNLQGWADLGDKGPYFGGKMFEGGSCEGWAFHSRKIGQPVSLVFRMFVNKEDSYSESGGAWFAVPSE